jgi:hypothetical protein
MVASTQAKEVMMVGILGAHSRMANRSFRSMIAPTQRGGLVRALCMLQLKFARGTFRKAEKVSRRSMSTSRGRTLLLTRDDQLANRNFLQTQSIIELRCFAVARR